ncbi:hypothetical protein K5A76_004099 [Salmonella enterica subsp. enterica serovar Bredeney]|nr:hypothetical protein [Salmonella enterica]EHY9683608.1 hypothetical protein [Salmonella enterica subsp. enterica serovar Bredeney]EIB4898405.1 hypothetical protein [Salmonella enterica subsp. enterica serovar Bredeney]
MGMFDEVRFSYRMPDGYDGEDFQTKDQECDGSFYEIDDMGRLLKKGKPSKRPKMAIRSSMS